MKKIVLLSGLIIVPLILLVAVLFFFPKAFRDSLPINTSEKSGFQAAME